jgi:hypothetical protein
VARRIPFQRRRRRIMKRTALMIAVLAVVGLSAAVLWPGGSSSPAAAALPESVQARYFDMTVTTSDGREFQLPDKTVTCSLEFAVSAEEGVYDCPAPHDIESLLAPPQVSASPAANALALVEIDAATLIWGLPANSWQTAQIQYGDSLSSANVLLGEELTSGQSGHIENSAWPDYSRGVHASYFYYRAQTNSSGYMGTEWLARGTQ